MAQTTGAIESCVYVSCIHYWNGTRINTTFSDWHDVIREPEKKSSTIKQILMVIFSRISIPKTLVFDNALEFYDEALNLCLENIGCKPYKTLRSNGLPERMVQTVKTGLKTCSLQKEKKKNRSFQLRLIWSYRTLPYTGRLESSSGLMGR